MRIRRVNEPLREAGVRVVDPETPGLGGPQVNRRRDGSQGPAHVSRGSVRLMVRTGGVVHETTSGRSELGSTAENDVRPVFFLNPLG